MAIALDTSASFLAAGFNAGPTTLTNNYTVTGTNPILAVWVAIWQDTGGVGTVTTCTFNGVSLTKAQAVGPEGSMAGEWWYLKAPPTGLHSLVVTVTGAVDGIRVMPISFTGCDQTAPLGVVGPTTALGISGNPAISITSGTANSVLVAGLSRFGNTAITATTWTNAQRANASNVTAVADYLITTTAGAQTATETGSVAQDWAMSAIELKPFVGGATVNSNFLMLL